MLEKTDDKKMTMNSFENNKNACHVITSLTPFNIL